jgi:hypothetical protein
VTVTLVLLGKALALWVAGALVFRAFVAVTFRRKVEPVEREWLLAALWPLMCPIYFVVTIVIVVRLLVRAVA